MFSDYSSTEWSPQQAILEYDLATINGRYQLFDDLVELADKNLANSSDRIKFMTDLLTVEIVNRDRFVTLAEIVERHPLHSGRLENAYKQVRSIKCVPSSLNKYIVQSLFPTSGQAAVVSAAIHSSDAKFVLKIVNVRSDDNEILVTCLERESSIINCLHVASQHPHIVKAEAIIRDQDWLALPLRVAPGKSLDHITDLSHLEVARIGVQIADSLDRVHSVHAIHRDIKPANINYCRKQATSTLLDFGSATSVQNLNGFTRQEPVNYLTKAYLAPEQLEFNEWKATKLTDIFQLGKVLHEKAIQGSRAGSNRAWLRSRYSLPPKLLETLNKCMANSPDERYQTALEVVKAFREVHISCDKWLRFRRRVFCATALSAAACLILAGIVVVNRIKNFAQVLVRDQQMSTQNLQEIRAEQIFLQSRQTSHDPIATTGTGEVGQWRLAEFSDALVELGAALANNSSEVNHLMIALASSIDGRFEDSLAILDAFENSQGIDQQALDSTRIFRAYIHFRQSRFAECVAILEAGSSEIREGFYASFYAKSLRNIGREKEAYEMYNALAQELDREGQEGSADLYRLTVERAVLQVNMLAASTITARKEMDVLKLKKLVQQLRDLGTDYSGAELLAHQDLVLFCEMKILVYWFSGSCENGVWV